MASISSVSVLHRLLSARSILLSNNALRVLAILSAPVADRISEILSTTLELMTASATTAIPDGLGLKLGSLLE